MLNSFDYIKIFRMINQDEFFKIFHDNKVEIHSKAKSFIEQRYIKV